METVCMLTLALKPLHRQWTCRQEERKPSYDRAALVSGDQQGPGAGDVRAAEAIAVDAPRRAHCGRAHHLDDRAARRGGSRPRNQYVSPVIANHGRSVMIEAVGLSKRYGDTLAV